MSDVQQNFSTTRMLLNSKPENAEQGFRDRLSSQTLKGGLFFAGRYKDTHPEYPLVTVITVEKNAVSELEDTIESVLSQDYPNIEYIIVDGASDQKTIDCIRRYESVLDVWISEPDNGFYCGLNKAIQMAGGEYIHVLNAKDLYLDKKTVSRFVNTFRQTQSDLIYCDTLMIDRESASGWVRYSQLTRFHLANGGFPQQSFFYRRKLFEKYGLFDESFVIAGDYEYLLRLILKHNVRKSYLNAPLIIFAKGGLSGKSHQEEKRKASIRYYPQWQLWLFTRKWFRKCFDSVDCYYKIRPFEWAVRKIFRLWTT